MVDFSHFLEALAIFVLGLILIGTNAYFKTKGANQAHKEDKEDITRIIKEVEHKFNSNLEIVKSKLDNTNSILKELNSSEKEIILSIFTETFSYYMFLTDACFNDIDMENNNEINDNLTLSSDKFTSFYMLYQTLKVFIPEENLDIMEKLNKCIDELMELRNKRFDYLVLLKSLNIKYQFEDAELRNNYYTEVDELNTSYFSNVDKSIEIISPLLNDFTDEVRKYIKSKSLN